MQGMSEKEMLKMLEFYEQKMHETHHPPHIREYAKEMYWHYLELLTKPDYK